VGFTQYFVMYAEASTFLEGLRLIPGGGINQFREWAA
jgi:hypothetical protein